MLLQNVSELRKFFDVVVPDLNQYECLLFILAARRKYWSEITTSEEALRREVLRECKWEIFFKKVKRLSVVDGLYNDKSGKTIPETAMSLFILLNPSHILRAWFNLQKEMNELLYQFVQGDKNSLRQFKRVDVNWFSNLHKTTSRKLYWLIDVDEKDEDLLNKILNLLDYHVVWISETRGGFHVIVPVDERTGQLLFKECVLEKYKDIVEVHKKAPMTPLPGTLQGGFLVREYRG